MSKPAPAAVEQYISAMSDDDFAGLVARTRGPDEETRAAVRKFFEPHSSSRVDGCVQNNSENE